MPGRTARWSSPPTACPRRCRPRRAGAQMLYLDATCPLVTKVHVEAERHHRRRPRDRADRPRRPPRGGRHASASCRPARSRWSRRPADAERVRARRPAKLAYVTQTTLSVDDTAEIVAVLQRRFPAIAAPHKEDICYATTNRQEAVKAIAAASTRCWWSARRIRPTRCGWSRSAEAGCADAQLVQRAADIDWRGSPASRTLGITAGASAPEVLVEEVIDRLRARYDGHRGAVDAARGAVDVQAAARLRKGADRRMTESRSHPHRRRLLGQSRPRAAGRRPARRRRREKELSGGEAATTNNRMELMAAIMALEALTRPYDVELPPTAPICATASPSGSTAGSAMAGYRRQEAGQERRAVAAARPGAGQARYRLALGRGHAGHTENERADLLARQAMAPLQVTRAPVATRPSPAPGRGRTRVARQSRRHRDSHPSPARAQGPRRSLPQGERANELLNYSRSSIVSAPDTLTPGLSSMLSALTTPSSTSIE